MNRRKRCINYLIIVFFFCFNPVALAQVPCGQDYDPGLRVLGTSNKWHLEVRAENSSAPSTVSIDLEIGGKGTTAMYQTGYGTWKVRGVFPIHPGTNIRFFPFSGDQRRAQYKWFPYLVKQPELEPCDPGSCVPETCESQGAGCGMISDGCGGIINCGDCPTGESCIQNQCVPSGNLPVPDGWLYTSGNKIYKNQSGQAVLWAGRGANIHDTRSCWACTGNQDPAEVSRRIDTLVDVWGADFMRLVMESYDTHGNAHNDPAYLRDLRQIVDHVGTKPGVYVLLSAWYDPVAIDQNGWPVLPQAQDLWRTLATEFAQDKHVLFGIVNEPKANFSGAQDAAVWNRMNTVAQTIRDAEAAAGAPAKHIIAVQGTRAWARILDYYVDHPITAGGGENIIYETHAYGPQSEFNRYFIQPSQTLPVVIGEFGPFQNAGGQMTIADCEQLILDADQLHIPWLAWTFHMRCPPNLFIDYSNNGCGIGMNLEPTSPWGQLIYRSLTGQ